MFRRIVSLLIAAATLAALASYVSSGENEKRLNADAAAPITVKDGSAFVSSGISAAELRSYFKEHDAVTVADAGGNELSLTDAVGTGTTVSLGGDVVTAVVPGDVDGNGAIGVRDVLSAMRFLVGEGGRYFGEAVDVDGDGEKNAADVIRMMKYLVGWNVVLGEANDPAADEDEALTMYFTSPMLRIARGDMTVYGDPDGVIFTAKNEIEDVHFILAASEARSDLQLDVGAIKNAAGDVLDREVRYGHYYDVVMWNDLNSRDFTNYTGGYYADPYPELRGTFDVKENENQSFIVKVKTTASAASGWYSATVRVLDAEGRELKKATLYAYVWDFAIDDHDLSRTTLDTYKYGLSVFFGAQADKKYYNSEYMDPLYKVWYDYILENKMNTADLPYSITDSRADEYLDDPRVTSFITQTGHDADCWDDPDTAPTLRAKYEKLSQKKEWLDKALIYTVDEPWDERGINWIKKQWNSAKEALGDVPFKTIVPYYSSWVPSLNMDLTEALWDYCNVFCPDSRVFIESADRKTRIKDREKYPIWGYYMDDAQFEKYGQYEPRYEALRERGDDMWWYICVTPEYPYPNFFTAYQGAWSRVVLWQQYRYHSDGFLYWSLVSWDMGEHDSRKINLNRTNGGDGMLIYPGHLWYGSDEPLPVPSIRFEAVRDGFEDYAYLRQLERFLGRGAALGYSNRITTDMNHFTQDWRDIDSVRNEMGWTLEELNAKG